MRACEGETKTVSLSCCEIKIKMSSSASRHHQVHQKREDVQQDTSHQMHEHDSWQPDQPLIFSMDVHHIAHHIAP